MIRVEDAIADIFVEWRVGFVCLMLTQFALYDFILEGADDVIFGIQNLRTINDAARGEAAQWGNPEACKSSVSKHVRD